MSTAAITLSPAEYKLGNLEARCYGSDGELAISATVREAKGPTLCPLSELPLALCLPWGMP